MQQIIQLFTTSGCHLCEQAEAMVNYLIENKPSISSRVRLVPVEISENTDLIDKYGVRIPVLSKETSELGWPFELEELEQWLNS
ncbi:glutaredoxin family protein [Aliikangiella sp. IMCC44359]|uniref:glutaredoxin family protein n=1 Tax=Aliikangiella sp. IMCC44359 TaxID=3459125 RepID=UPI00403AA563